MPVSVPTLVWHRSVGERLGCLPCWLSHFRWTTTRTGGSLLCSLDGLWRHNSTVTNLAGRFGGPTRPHQRWLTSQCTHRRATQMRKPRSTTNTTTELQRDWLIAHYIRPAPSATPSCHTCHPAVSSSPRISSPRPSRCRRSLVLRVLGNGASRGASVRLGSPSIFPFLA